MDDIQRLFQFYRALDADGKEQMFASAAKLIARQRIDEHVGRGGVAIRADIWVWTAAVNTMPDMEAVRQFTDPVGGVSRAAEYMFPGGLLSALSSPSERDYQMSAQMIAGFR